MIATLGIIVWWLFFSRAPWSDRLGALVVMAVAVVATKAVAHPSITGAGQGFLIYLMGIQLMSLALVLWAVASRGLSAGARRAVDGGRAVGRVRAVRDHPDRRRQQQHAGLRLPLAMDADG